MKAIILLTIILFSGFTYSDQSDERLNVLFENLRFAQSNNIATEIERTIWQIWVEHDDQQISMMMAAGTRAMSDGYLDFALLIFDELVTQKPNYAEGWNKRATVNYMLNNMEESIQDIEKTLMLEPRHFGALSGLGLIHFKQRSYVDAINAFESVLKINPMSTGSSHNIQKLRKLILEQTI